MLGIWHEGDWLKRDLAQLIYGWVEHDSPILGWILNSSTRVPSHGILLANVLVHMWYLWMLYPHYFFCLYASYEYVL